MFFYAILFLFICRRYKQQGVLFLVPLWVGPTFLFTNVICQNRTNLTTPGRVRIQRRQLDSVAMPPDDWLCQKLEKLDTTVAEGYRSRTQDSAALKKDQFIKIPKSQSRWYQMHTLRSDGPHRPGKSLFSWSDNEAKVNSQFPRIIKASAYLPSGPPSRPISQDYLRRWERCAREGSYVVKCCRVQ